MSKSTHQIAIKAVDQTGGAFKSIKSTAAATGASIKSMVGGAIAAAGAYLGFRAVKGGIEELGHLSDIAQKTSTNVAELTQAATAFNVLGIQNMGVEQFAKSMDYMAKTTGRVGMEGFTKTLDELASIPDIAQRGQAAMKVFGNSGMEMMPLINGGHEGVAALRNLCAAMPALPQSAADAGDKVADAMAVASNGMKSIWLQGIAAVCNWFDGHFAGGIREAAAQACNWLEYYSKLAFTKVSFWFSQMQHTSSEIGTFIGTFIGAKMNGASWSEAMNMAKDQYSFERDANMEAEADEKASLERRQENWRKAYEERKKIIAELQANYDKAAKSSGDYLKLGDAVEAAKAMKAVRNDLILGGSNAATKLQILGPSLQSEQKKTNALLEKVVANTEKTAENTETAHGEESAEVLN